MILFRRLRARNVQSATILALAESAVSDGAPSGFGEAMLTVWIAVGITFSVAVWALGKAYAVDDLARRLWRIHLQDQHWPLISRVSDIEGRLAGQGPKIRLPLGSDIRESGGRPLAADDTYEGRPL